MGEWVIWGDPIRSDDIKPTTLLRQTVHEIITEVENEKKSFDTRKQTLIESTETLKTTSDDATINDVTLNDVKLNDVASDDEKLNDGKLNDEKLNDGKLNDMVSDDEKLNDGKLNDMVSDDEKLNDMVSDDVGINLLLNDKTDEISYYVISFISVENIDFYAFKIYCVSDNLEQINEWIKAIKLRNPYFKLYVGQVGKWLQ